GKKIELKNVDEVKNILSQIDVNLSVKQDEVEAELSNKAKSFTITSVTKKERKRNPAPPFITSSLQQEAARKLNFRAAKTMSVAQQLYEGMDLGKEGTVGLITYMRTDSTRISPVAQEEVRKFISEKYGADYVPSEPRNYVKKNSNAQDAHEAIRPSGMYEPDQIKSYLKRDQYRLYKLIWERFVAS